MNQEKIQEEEYDFPYHHLIDIKPFSETRHLFWGYKYSAYVEKVVNTLERFNFNSLIEIGCGDGKVLYEISKKYQNKKLVGTDYSEKSLRFARAFSPHLSFETKTNDKFDGFVLIEVLEHINPLEMQSFLDSVCKNLNDKGFGIITTPSDNVPLNPKHYQHFNESSIYKTLSKHFEIVSFEYTSAQTVGVSLIQRILANRFFILNYKPIINALYKIYKKRYLNASKENATQVFVIVKKK
jgi:2-polyprenyl-3-methyl-5-hydroxy-6-metoxy-1,4-benzoquinol methylase